MEHSLQLEGVWALEETHYLSLMSKEDTVDVPVALAGGCHSTAGVSIHFRPHLISQL